MMALHRREDQKQDDVYRVRQAARTLDQIVLQVREATEHTTLE